RRSATHCQRGHRRAIERCVGSGPRVMIGIGPLPSAALFPFAELKGPQLVEGSLLVRRHGLAARVLQRKEQRGENGLRTLPVSLGFCLGVESSQQPLFVSGRLALTECMAEYRTSQKIRHSRVTGDANATFDLRPVPCKPFLLSRVKVLRCE